MFKTTTKNNASISSGSYVDVRSFNLKTGKKTKNRQIAKLKNDVKKLKETKEKDSPSISTNDELDDSIENERLSQFKKQSVALVAENINKSTKQSPLCPT